MLELLGSRKCSRTRFGIVLSMLFLVGCQASTQVTFVAPTGSMIEIPERSTLIPGLMIRTESKRHELPKTIELVRPMQIGQSIRSDVKLELVDGEDRLLADGLLEVFAIRHVDVDRFATNTCTIGPAQIAWLRAGNAVIVTGKAASGQMIYQLTFGKRKS